MSDEPRSSLPPGYSAPFPERLPNPTALPAIFAFAATLVVWGLISSLLVSLIGGIVLVYSLLQWVGEIWHDAR